MARGHSAVALALALVGCATGDGFSPSVVRIDELPEGTTVASAPTELELDSRIYKLQTYLWRDFMPPAGPEGSLLMAVVKIIAVDGQPLPQDLDADLLYVLNGNEAWVTKFAGEARPPGEPYLEKSARDGPRWGPDILVDVAIRLTGAGGPIGYLRAVDQQIHATY